jgi:two-component system, chemotaxis family, chemotaxis protein CheY
MRVLIIDDSVVMRRIVESALRHAGLEVTEVLEAPNGAEGLAVLERCASERPVDLILCDVHMPVLDGPGLLVEKCSRNLAPGVPVLMITADTSDPYLLRAIAAGAQGYISKPFTLEQMHAGIAHFLPNLSHWPDQAPLATDAAANSTGGTP